MVSLRCSKWLSWIDDQLSFISSNWNSYSFSTFNRTCVNDGKGALSYIAPQTRLRIVDNSPWSHIAASQPTSTGTSSKMKVPKGTSAESVKTSANDPSFISGSSSTGTILNVQSFINVGFQDQVPKPAKCIRVYNKRNKGQIG